MGRIQYGKKTIPDKRAARIEERQAHLREMEAITEEARKTIPAEQIALMERANAKARETAALTRGRMASEMTPEEVTALREATREVTDNILAVVGQIEDPWERAYNVAQTHKTRHRAGLYEGDVSPYIEATFVFGQEQFLRTARERELTAPGAFEALLIVCMNALAFDHSDDGDSGRLSAPDAWLAGVMDACLHSAFPIVPGFPFSRADMIADFDALSPEAVVDRIGAYGQDPNGLCRWFVAVGVGEADGPMEWHKSGFDA